MSDNKAIKKKGSKETEPIMTNRITIPARCLLLYDEINVLDERIKHKCEHLAYVKHDDLDPHVQEIKNLKKLVEARRAEQKKLLEKAAPVRNKSINRRK